jgi:hypothetical protein
MHWHGSQNRASEGTHILIKLFTPIIPYQYFTKATELATTFPLTPWLGCFDIYFEVLMRISPLILIKS